VCLLPSRINSVLVALLHAIIIADKDRTDNVKMADKRRIDIKVTEKEFEILDRYCNEMGLSKTVVLRELIRKLGEEIAAKAAQSLFGF
jgi:Ribbon-helix-helix protein, copG family